MVSLFSECTHSSLGCICLRSNSTSNHLVPLILLPTDSDSTVTAQRSHVSLFFQHSVQWPLWAGPGPSVWTSTFLTAADSGCFLLLRAERSLSVFSITFGSCDGNYVHISLINTYVLSKEILTVSQALLSQELLSFLFPGDIFKYPIVIMYLQIKL